MTTPNHRSLEEIDTELGKVSDADLLSLGDRVVSLAEEKMGHPDFHPNYTFGDIVSGWYESLRRKINNII